ncbi:mucosa-associated lymphoid tissue lymphoma translocation protein 1 isoform X2 [Eublepharis macularius]|uniref:Mucosa-associated lymphoid tissue lymphoma translocation protein 1 isoform X2 n=1 Tax=Eublepharis macularius TaxID=481883 RepID=A0AA97JNP2_EUBMA|nr:mucosa-associated lymphoid tissue lymphoma translocation protein 1 isoform X2 [Eublepharis macularius]
MAGSQPTAPLPLSRLPEPLLRRLSDLLDRAALGRGWRDLAQLAASHGRLKLSPQELEQCSLQVLEPDGSPSRSLLQLLGEKGCTVLEIRELLQALEHSEALQCLGPSSIKIAVEPESQAVLSGKVVRLNCLATGYPLLHYQWFKQEKEIPHGNAPELVFNQVSADDAGFYICRVNSGLSFVFSQWAQLVVCDLQGAGQGISLDLPENKLFICTHPLSQSLIAGEMLVLHCEAIGTPVPQYQWFKNGSPLMNGDKKAYVVPCADVEHQGAYWCRVYNDQDAQESQKAEVVVEDLTGVVKPDLQKQSTERNYAVDKVALLMGNMSYCRHPKLKAPLVDVYELTNLLRQLDFKVVSLLDLTEPEMRNAVDEFLLLLDKGVYGLLYYAGHGYENYGNSFMVPIDAPNPYRAANCLCVQNILKRMQAKETGLNVFLLDMCRKRNEYDNTILILDALKVTANIVFGYATCQGAEAFEIQQSGLANGIFMKFLKERLLEDKKITVLLDGVAEDMGKCHLTKGKQALEIRSSLSEKRALTDPIQQTGTSAEALARNLQWAKAHELPESMCLEFECGVQIQLGFAAEFSNVMIVYTRIVKKPPEITVCKAYVTDFPPDLDVDPKESNKGTPEETGSYLLSKDLPKHCLYTRISSLQKLKEDLTFAVCLHYEYAGIDDVVDEKKLVNIGKPLIAKLRIHQGFRKNSCIQSCCVPSGPCLTPSPVVGAAKHGPPSSHHLPPHPYMGFCQLNPARLGDPLQPVKCHCGVTPDRLVGWQPAWVYPSISNQSNDPVETSDDTGEELGSHLSGSLRLSHPQ